MSAATAILERARNLGVSLTIAGDKIKAKGPRPAVEQILPVLREHKPEVMAALADHNPPLGLFQWLPLDSEAAKELLDERIGILLDSGISEAEAVREAGWHLERARCWVRFQSHARIILAAPQQDRHAFLEEYRESAARTFGREIASQMAASMASWVTARVE